MAFWGAEVKPGKPVTHKFDQARGRLRISQAALGIGSATNKSVVQCNIGDKCPVILCVLLPDKSESCHLDLEFEEADDVIFSVIGPRSVHLTGYYSGVRQSNHNDSSESYGVDIANSDSEHSVHGSEEDSYEDSFIDDDDDPEVFPPSPISSDAAYDEEMSDKKKPKGRKGSRKRLKKRCKSIESEDERNSQLHNHKGGLVFKSDDENWTTLLESRTTQAEEKLEKEICKTDDEKIENGGSRLQTEANGIYEKKTDNIDNLAVNQSKFKKSREERRMETPEGVLVLDSDDEDCTLISTLLGRTTQAEEKCLKDMSKTYDKKIENGGSHLQTQDNVIDVKKTDCIDNLAVNQSKSKKKRKERTKETPDVYNEIHNNVMKDEKSLHLEERTQEKRPAADREVNIEGGQTCDDSLTSTKSDLGNDVRLKKKRKISNEGENSVCQATMDDELTQGQVNQDEGGSQNSGRDISMGNKDQNLPYDKKTDIASSPAVDEDQLKDKKSKKKKKKKTKGIDENKVIMLAESDKNKFSSGSDDKNVNSKSSKARTLSNGLIIQDIETGKPDGKVATSGKKIKVYYVGKLRDGGHIIDSNIGKSPLKFRLGAEGVTEGWNIGLDGMRVGGKRRLTIPPKNGDGSQGAGENVPPNSWLVYDFELVGVR